MKRRDFLTVGTAGALSALSYRRVMGANDRIGLALIGSGRRGTEVAKAFVSDARVDLRCICDIYDVHRERAAQALASRASLITAHEDALARKDVDAVLLAVPDHLHLTLGVQSLAAGKNLYIEKPTVHRWQERLVLKGALAGSGKVLQCGTQQRSGAHYQRAKEEIFGGKKLGQVLFVRAVWSNFPWQSRHIQPLPKPATLDWERFLGPAKKVPYETVRYDSWRYFPDYGGGVLADILTHWADVAQWMMDDPAPRSAVAEGGIYVFVDDGRENPDTVNAIIKYRNWNLSFESSVAPIRNDNPSVLFEGTEGTLDLSRSGYTFIPNKGDAVHVAAEGSLEKAHTANFLNAVLNGAPPSANLESGIEAIRPVQMALKAYWTKSVVTSKDLDTI